MSLGEVPGGNLRAYYKLSGLTDSSGNGFSLTNNNSVSFSSIGLFGGGCADFGSSGTNKGLTYGANIFSTLTPDRVHFSFWMKLNSTSNTTAGSDPTLFVATSKTSDTAGRQYYIHYSISSGIVTVTFTRATTGGQANASCTCTTTQASDWIQIIAEYDSTIGSVIAIYNRNGAIISATSLANVVQGQSSITAPTIFLSIGNVRDFTLQGYVQIDEVIVDENLYTQNNGGGTVTNRNRIKYRTHTAGRFIL